MKEESHIVHLYDRHLSNYIDGSFSPIGHLLVFGTVNYPISIVAFNRAGVMCGLWTADDKTYELPNREYYKDGNGLRELVMASNKDDLTPTLETDTITA